MLGSRDFFICRKVKPKWLVDFRWSNGSATIRSFSGRSTTFVPTSKYLVDVLNLLPPANEVCEGCFHRCLSVHRRGFLSGLSLSRGSLSRGGLCPRGSLSTGVSVQGVFVQGSLSRGGLCPRGLCPDGLCLCLRGSLSGGKSLSRGSLSKEGLCPRGLCPDGLCLCLRGSLSGGRSLSRGISVRETPCAVKSRR